MAQKNISIPTATAEKRATFGPVLREAGFFTEMLVSIVYLSSQVSHVSLN